MDDRPQTNDEEPSPKASAARRLGLAAVLLAVSTLLSRLLGFGREVIISTQHGATGQTDAYYAAFTLPELMNYFLAGGTLSITFIPLFSSYLARGDEEGGWRLFSTVATTMGAALLAATVIAEIGAPWFVPMLLRGEQAPEMLELTIVMTRIVLPAQLFFYVAGLLNATLFTREVFWPSALAPLVYNGCIILGGVLLEPWLGIKGYAVGVIVGALLGPMGLALWAARGHIRFTPNFAPKDPGFVRFALLTLPLMLGATLVTVDEWLLRYFGGAHPEGTITTLNHSRKLMMVLFAVIGQAAGQAALPFLTRLFHQGKEREMGDMLASSLERVAFLSVVGALGLASVGEPLVWAVFHRGAFNAYASEATSVLLLAFCVGLPAWAIQSLAVRGFYAREDTLTPMVLGSVVLAVMLPTYWALDWWLGPMGLAISTSIGITLNASLTLIVYRKRAGVLPLGGVARAFARALVFGALTGGAALWASHMARGSFGIETNMGAFACLCAAIAAWLFVAAPLIALTRPPELMFAIDKVARKLKLKRG